MKKILLTLFILFTIFSSYAFAYQTESLPVETAVGKPPADTGANIASCTFYRGGDGIAGVRIGNPQMASFITDVATKVDIPTAVLAGVMRVESVQGLMSTDTTYLQNDYDAHSSGVAFGIMQFTPGTFINTFDQNKAALGSLFNKTGVSTKIVGQSDMEPNNLLRMYSVRDSIIAAAFKIKKDKELFNGNGPWNEAAVNAVATSYYGCLLYPSCNTGPNSYGGDVWKSYSSCQAPSAPIGGGGPIAGGGSFSGIPADAASCPIPNGKIICGSHDHPSNNCGHCGLNYPDAQGNCSPYPGTAFAIDVGAGDFDHIYLPQIHNHVIKWNFVGEEIGRLTNEAIQKYTGTDQVTQEKYYLQLHHSQPGSGSPGAHMSGDLGGNVCGDGCQERHTHVQLASGGNFPGNSNNGWLDSALYFCGNN